MDTQDQPRRPSADEFAAQLRAQEKSQRPGRWLILLLLVLVFGVPLAAIVWWFWPGPAPPEALVVAFDAVGRRDEDITLGAGIEVMHEQQANVRMSGWPILFASDPLVAAPGHPQWSRRATTTAEADFGVARCKYEWSSAPAIYSFVAVYSPDQKRTRAEDRAQVFCWPKEINVLLLDVERTLADVEFAKWQTAKPADIAQAKNAAASLHKIWSAKSYQLVYLACAVERPQDYLRARAFVRSTQANEKPFPPGPVLGRQEYGSGNQDSNIRDNIAHIKKVFSGKVFAVTRHADTAAAFQEAGATAFFLGAADQAPPGTKAAKDWSELVKVIP